MLYLFLPFPTFLSVLSFSMKQHEKYQLNLQFNLSKFPFLVNRVLKQNKLKKHAALLERIVCDLFPIFIFIFFQNANVHGYLAISSC